MTDQAALKMRQGPIARQKERKEKDDVQHCGGLRELGKRRPRGSKTEFFDIIDNNVSEAG